MTKLTGIDVSNSSWCDANLTGISWGNDGRDLILTWDRSNKPIGTLTCTWAHALKVDITMGVNEGGYPLTWDAEITQVSKSEWSLIFDFASQGIIKLKCTEIFLETIN